MGPYTQLESDLPQWCQPLDGLQPAQAEHRRLNYTVGWVEVQRRSSAWQLRSVGTVWHRNEVKVIFRSAYRLSGTRIVGCLEITDVGCNLKKFDGLSYDSFHSFHFIYSVKSS